MPSDNQEANDKRAAVYIDGFNLYYSIVDMKEPFLKWIDLWRLSELVCKPERLTLKKVVFCTAVPAHYPDKRDRHNTYNAALIAKGVEVVKGHHVFNPEIGKYSEKQTDINVALSLILDGIDDLYDVAFLVSADSDLAAAARVFASRLPAKRLIAVAPPNRDVPDKSMPYVSAHFVLKKAQIEACVMPAMVPTPRGSMIRRPKEYAPPVGWVHPDQRPR